MNWNSRVCLFFLFCSFYPPSQSTFTRAGFVYCLGRPLVACSPFVMNTPLPLPSLFLAHSRFLSRSHSCYSPSVVWGSSSFSSSHGARDGEPVGCLSPPPPWTLDVPWGPRGCGQLWASSSSPPPVGCARPHGTVRYARLLPLPVNKASASASWQRVNHDSRASAHLSDLFALV